MKKQILVLGALAFAHCGGGGTGSVSIDDLGTTLLDKSCQSQVDCGFEPDLATCKADHAFNNNQFLTLVADAKAGKISYDADKAGACLDFLTGQGCGFNGFQNDTNNPC